MDGFYAKILKKPLHWEECYIIPSNEPGLGVEINEDIIKNYPYNSDELHLTVHEKK